MRNQNTDIPTDTQSEVYRMPLAHAHQGIMVQFNDTCENEQDEYHGSHFISLFISVSVINLKPALNNCRFLSIWVCSNISVYLLTVTGNPEITEDKSGHSRLLLK